MSDTTTPETTFQQKADEYAKAAIASLREMVEAMEHAAECDGEMDCEECAGEGKDGDGDECAVCEGAGTVPCTEGKDSDEPESWHDEERARKRIQEDALSVEVRSGWHTPGDADSQDAEYSILLTTGGPAARIVGDLDDHKQPHSAVFEFQDWFKPWTEAYINSSDRAVLLQYAQQFYFGD